MKKRTLKKSKKAKARARKARPKARAKKTAKKKSSAKKSRVTRAPRAPKPIGTVTHFYTNLGVAIVKFNKKVSVGTKLHYKGATTDFLEAVKSMQFNHEEIKTAPKGKQIGIKVKKRVREYDSVYLAE